MNPSADAIAAAAASAANEREISALKTELAFVQARLAVSQVDVESIKQLHESSEKERAILWSNLKEMEAECATLKAKLADMCLKASVEATANRNTMVDRILRGTIYDNTFVKSTPTPTQAEPEPRGVPIVEMFPLFCCNSR